MNDNLPPLPPYAPEFKPRWPTDPGGYNEKQMQAYARAAIERQRVPAGYVLVPNSLIDEFPEINPSNYGHDDACALNRWGCEVVTAAIEHQSAAPQPQPVQEPVAWRILDKDPLGCGDDRWVVYTQDDFKPGVCPTDYFNIEPLYTSPQAQPLSNEQITKLPVWRHFVGLMPDHHVEITRAIEQAHGIPKGTT